MIETRAILGKYILQDKLGESKLAWTYKAKLKEDSQSVNSDQFVIKIFKDKVWLEEKNYQLLKSPREKVKFGQLCNIRYLAKIIGVGSSQDHAYVVREYIEGEKLSQPSKDTAVAYVKQICEAVRQLHNVSLVHGGLCPENVIVSNDYVKVTDFGTSSILLGKVSGIGDSIPSNKSPFIDPGTSLPDTRSDIYSVAAIAFWLITGSMPEPRHLPGDTPQAIRQALLKEYDRIERFLSDFTQELETPKTSPPPPPPDTESEPAPQFPEEALQITIEGVTPDGEIPDYYQTKVTIGKGERRQIVFTVKNDDQKRTANIEITKKSMPDWLDVTPSKMFLNFGEKEKLRIDISSDQLVSGLNQGFFILSIEGYQEIYIKIEVIKETEIVWKKMLIWPALLLAVFTLIYLGAYFWTIRSIKHDIHYGYYKNAVEKIEDKISIFPTEKVLFLIPNELLNIKDKLQKELFANIDFRPPDKSFKSGETYVLHSGDRYRFKISLSALCYFYAYQVDSSGKLGQLFPNKTFSDLKNPVDKTNSFWIPQQKPGNEMALQLDNVPGEETVYFIGSRWRCLDLEELYASLEKTAGESIDPEHVRKFKEIIQKREAQDVPAAFTASINFIHSKKENFTKQEENKGGLSQSKQGEPPAGYTHTNTLGQEFVYIPAGEFTMGSDQGERDERPVHKVYLDAYYIGKYEVTNREYMKFVWETGRRGPKYVDDSRFNGNNQPVVGVNWYDAVAYCNWLSNKAGQHYRLPTEAEWEKAARGTDGRKYPWGDEAPDAGGKYRANYNPGGDWLIDADGYKYTAPVGSYESGKSPYGVYDMAGNVWEWCADWYKSTYYDSAIYINPKGKELGDYRVGRGGSWQGNDGHIRGAVRYSAAPGYMNNNLGFRYVVGTFQFTLSTPSGQSEASQPITKTLLSSLQNYKIDIYYQKKITKAENFAQNMKSIITAWNLRNRVILSPRAQNFFVSTGLPRGNEVRYEPGKEDELAQALAELLNSTNASLNFQLRSVVNRTPGTLSIYIWIKEREG